MLGLPLDRLPDLRFSGQGAGQRDVLDHRDAVLGGDGLDLLRHFVVALGQDDRGVHLALLVLQRDGHVGGVGDDTCRRGRTGPAQTLHGIPHHVHGGPPAFLAVEIVDISL